MNWSEQKIAAFMARWTFHRKCLVVVPNCSWTGHECDVLAITRDLRVIDIEIKISVSDLRADAAKDKWFHSWDWKIDGPYTANMMANRRPRRWPRKVWKHYYAVPADIWSPALAVSISRDSGVLLMHHNPAGGVFLKAWRGARPCRDAERIDAEDAVDIARLASLRMWDAFDNLRERISELDHLRKELA